MSNTTAKLIEAVEKADSAVGLLQAVKALAAAKDESAIPTLIAVLGYNNPGAAVAAVDGLIELGETSVTHLLQQIDGYNYGARAWAIRVLACIGDPRAIELLINAAMNDFSLSVRRAAAKGLGSIRFSLLETEKVAVAQIQVLKTLLAVTQDGEWVVRYAAVVGLESLYKAIVETHPESALEIKTKFKQMLDTDTEIAVSARVKLALDTLAK